MVLQGIRVLDFGRYIAGPFCASMLADLGAEVIRIERLQGSEDRYLLPVSDNGDGAMFLHLNRNKLGMTLNPLKPEGREVVGRLVASADVVIANLPQQALVQMGLDYETLVTYRKDIILVCPSAFGKDGPYAKRTGFDGVAQAMSGAVYLSGFPDQPARSVTQWADYSTAMFSAYGTLAALMHRQAAGEGQIVETNLMQSAMTLNHAYTLEQSVCGSNRKATGNRSQLSGPVDIFRTKDGHITLSVVGNALFERWATLIGEAHWLEDAEFQSDELRGENGALLSERTQHWCAQYTTDEAMALLDEARIPAGPVLSPQKLLEDPHVVETDIIHFVDYPGLSQPAPMMAAPFTLSAMKAKICQRPPTLGEHTDQILNELGYSSKEIGGLHAARVV